MTEVIHQIEKISVKNNVYNPVFLLTNKAGGYISLSDFPISRFQGVFFNSRHEMFKVIENIIPLDCGNVRKLTNKFYSVERERENAAEKFFMPLTFNSLVYELGDEKEIQLDLDMKKSYDDRQFGRFYSINKEKGKTIIKLTKKTDGKEDGSEGKEEYSLFLIINSADFEEIKEFYPIFYSFDRERNSWPYERYVFKALKLKGKKFVFSFSTNKKKAIEENNFVERNLENLKRNQEAYVNGFRKRISKKEIKMAYKAACLSLDHLVTNINGKRGIYAGLWWFFQFWARDESISMKALIQQKKFNIAKEILFGKLLVVRGDGRIDNRIPPSNLDSADAVGWVFLRLRDLIKELEKERQLNEYLNLSELRYIKHQLEHSVFLLLKNHTEDDLAVNKTKETWMDTVDREGARIEIQALRLAMYSFLKELSLKLNDSISLKMASHLEHDLREKVKNMFFVNGCLKDGVNDPMIRPNIFIAYYVYPELLSKQEWQECFKDALKKLWIPWGGLSTIDRESEFYIEMHSGSDDKSYHSGDSWYWINNLAALCLHRVSAIRFRNYIKKILDASTKDILWKGIVGSNAEISSSKEQDSKGCLSQAWSNAMYIEMINELF